MHRCTSYVQRTCRVRVGARRHPENNVFLTIIIGTWLIEVDRMITVILSYLGNVVMTGVMHATSEMGIFGVVFRLS
jgi:hypothetical protein